MASMGALRMNKAPDFNGDAQAFNVYLPIDQVEWLRRCAGRRPRASVSEVVRGLIRDAMLADEPVIDSGTRHVMRELLD